MSKYDWLNQEEVRLDYLLGLMSPAEAYDWGIIDQYGYEAGTVTRASVQCRCCSRDGLRWGRHEGKWRLFEDGDLHRCPVNPLPEHRDDDR